MDTAMMYYDDTRGRSLLDKLTAAVAEYRRKFDAVPNRCHVHPSALAGDAQLVRMGSVIVVADGQVLADHLWLGIADNERETR